MVPRETSYLCYITQSSTFFDRLFNYVPEKNVFKYPALFCPLKET